MKEKEEEEGECEGEHPWINWINNGPSPLLNCREKMNVHVKTFTHHNVGIAWIKACSTCA